MKQYLTTIEFRYNTPTYKSNKVTLGISDTFEEACAIGNSVLEDLEKRFDLHVFPDGTPAEKERFSIDGGCFGSRHSLIANLAYLRTPFDFYAKITTLKYDDVSGVIDGIIVEQKKEKPNGES